MRMLITVLAALLAGGSALGAEPAPPAAVEKMLVTLLQATADNDLVRFESVCDDTMREAMTPALFRQVNAQLGPLLKAGYTRTYLGSKTQGDITAYLWKLDLKSEGAPDLQAEMAAHGHAPQ